MQRISTLILALSAAMTIQTTQAHMFWLEKTSDQQTRAYFGEYSENLTETQAGPLKAFASAKVVQNGKELQATVQPNYFAYSTSATGDVRADNNLVHGDLLAQFRAKAGRSSTAHVSELEIVPVAANSNQFVLIFQDQPLAKQEVEVIAGNRWSKKYETDEQGRFHIETPWKGRYVIEVSKNIDEPGEYNQQQYQKRVMVATLSFDVK